MATLTGLDPREKMGKTEGLFWGQKALDVSKRQRKQRPADKIENLKLTNGFHWQFDQYTTLGL
jgi:hypothetical protein